MDVKGRSSCNSTTQSDEEMMDVRRGPWTVEEDLTLINYIAHHGEGRWNSLSRSAGLKRTGKSCRLRWLNYLRPDVRRGNITLEEQLLILDLHSRWGNRWSKIAQYLPGRTDNEIKNYWRTRVQKHAKQLKCDVNSKQFKDTMKYLWMPRLMERIQAAAAAAGSTSSTTSTSTATVHNHPELSTGQALNMLPPPPTTRHDYLSSHNTLTKHYTTPENSTSSDSFGTQVSPVSDLTDHYPIPIYDNPNPDYFHPTQELGYQESLAGFYGGCDSNFNYGGSEVQAVDQTNNPNWLDGGETSDSLWNVDNIWFLQQQLNPNIM